MPESEFFVDRLASEAQLLLVAGTVTTTRTLDVCSYYILSNDRIRSRLKEELKSIMASYPEIPRLQELEKLPYLQAIINETLRSAGMIISSKKRLLRRMLMMSHNRIDGNLNRLPRCSPDEPLQYKQWTIPRNVSQISSFYFVPTNSHDCLQVAVGMSAYMMQTDPTIYEKPLEFIPDRWLGTINPLMTRNMVPFSRGSRNCLGKK